MYGPSNCDASQNIDKPWAGNATQNLFDPTVSYDDIRALLGEGSIEHIDEEHPFLQWHRTGELMLETYPSGDFKMVHRTIFDGTASFGWRGLLLGSLVGTREKRDHATSALSPD